MNFRYGYRFGSGSRYFCKRSSRCQQKIIYIFYISFQRWKVLKMSQNSRNQCFSYYFCLIIEGSGSGRSKNIWVLRIRIRNTAAGWRLGGWCTWLLRKAGWRTPASRSASVWTTIRSIASSVACLGSGQYINSFLQITIYLQPVLYNQYCFLAPPPCHP